MGTQSAEHAGSGESSLGVIVEAMSELHPITFALKGGGESLIIRSAEEGDYLQLFNLQHSVIEEQIYLLLTPDEHKLSKDEVVSFINNCKSKNGSILLVAVIDGSVIGVLEFTRGHTARIKHAGSIEIFLHKNYREQGIGSMLMNTFLQWAAANPEIENINLYVHANNQKAIEFYTKFGFEKDGIRRNGLKYGIDKYIDILMMSKFIKNG